MGKTKGVASVTMKKIEEEVKEKALKDLGKTKSGLPKLMTAAQCIAVQSCKEVTLEKMRSYAGEAMETLVDVMHNGSDRNRITAAVKILEYAAGKPAEMDLSVNPNVVVDTTGKDAEKVIESHSEEDLQRMIELEYAEEE